MKKIHLILIGAAFGPLLHAATPLKDNIGQSVPIMGDKIAQVALDSSEIDTGRVFDLTDLPFRHFTDTIGVAWMRCDDSSGTDSVGGLLKWQGNPSYPASGPQGLWENIDSVAIAVAGGVETQTKKAVVVANNYMAIRFILRNQLAPAVAKKTTCNNIVLNRHKRMFIPQ